MPIQHTEAELKLGTVDGKLSTMHFSLVLAADGSGRLRIYVAEHNGRRGGEIIELGAEGFRELREMVDHVQSTIDRMKAGGQMHALIPGR